jgi:DNA-binding NarL/FixJ family response regulator
MSPSKSVAVAIVEDDATIRAGWVNILDRLPGYHIAGKFSNGEEALTKLAMNPPDFVLMDINLPGMSGIECTRELKRLLPDVQVIMLTMFGDRDRIFDALRAGASGYLLKRTTPSALKAALEEALAGGAPMSPYVARQVVQYFQTSPFAHTPGRIADVDRLSPKENNILKLLSEGCQYKEIAAKLDISMDTVRTHIRRIYHKLHVHSRTDAVVKYLASERAES